MKIQKGHLSVGDGHRLYYETFGNPKGKPVVLLHGGPGAGFNDSHKRYFDPRTQRVILFDQRGAGRSRPFASLEANTTWHLVEDVNQVLDHFEVESAYLFGGSWGTTLALAYAIRNPERVRGIWMRALFLGSEEAVDYYIAGGVADSFPDHWERFLSHVPKAHRSRPAEYYYEKMRNGDSKTRAKLAYEWAYYEFSCIALSISHEQIVKAMKTASYRSLSPLEAHYMVNRCFMKGDYILDNVHRIAHIPAHLAHGRYDVICPPRFAWELKKRYPKLELEWECIGHQDLSDAKFARYRKSFQRLIARR